MSKIGKKPISIPAGVTLTIQPGSVAVKGSKGEQIVPVANPAIVVEVKENLISVTRKNDERETKAFHGLIRSLIANAIEGVTHGYKKTLKLVGTGYRATSKGAAILCHWFSHPVEAPAVAGISLWLRSSTIHIEGMIKS
jgi:large subunit ribosomal protein L6